MKPYNPLKYVKKHDLDWAEGILKIVDDGSRSVILLETKAGEIIVLNVVEDSADA